HKTLSSVSLEALQTLLASVEFHPFFAVIAPIIILNLMVPIVLRSYRGMVMREITTIFAALYFGWFLAHTILLRNLPNGLELTTFFLIVVVANDVGAYTAGRAFGSHKLLPEISPKKTWEGFFGGISGSLLASAGFSFLLADLTFPLVLGAGLVISLTAPFGDLIVSVIKRDMNRKDASALIPGHGGLLDRADSIILSAPNYYYYLVLLRSLAS
ncbi:MAG: phosphatidate cytidylyltransferase, partial [Candidatus Obscuribacterales bacterium]|nr:phosphatidate cytidylyltransferase [Candidatus Obscuribacterales bacterium]